MLGRHRFEKANRDLGKQSENAAEWYYTIRTSKTRPKMASLLVLGPDGIGNETTSTIAT
jgi:hypothetical protein